MELTQDEVIHILKLIDESPMGRFSLQVGDLKLEVAKGTGAASDAAIRALHVAEPAPAKEPAPPKPEPVAAEQISEPTVASAEPTDPNLLAIKAPILGIFYRRPDPGSPPYVEENSFVEADTTVALIEVMKLFNPVKAGMRGRICKICVNNGQLVEYGQLLFLVQPE